MFASLVKQHNGRGDMCAYFNDGFRPKGKTEAAVVFKQRHDALTEALYQVASGKLDRTFASNGELSRVLLRLRKATMGSEVHYSSIFCSLYKHEWNMLWMGCYLHYFLTGWYDPSNKNIEKGWRH